MENKTCLKKTILLAFEGFRYQNVSFPRHFLYTEIFSLTDDLLMLKWFILKVHELFQQIPDHLKHFTISGKHTVVKQTPSKEKIE